MRILFLVLFGFLFSASSLNDARKANDAFRNGDYEAAIELYKSAIEASPEDARLYFNLGTALAETGNAEEAVQTFQTAKELMEDPRQQAMADYNAGTILSKAEMYDEALEFFREALRKNPDDPDAKHNYEMSVKKQQEQEEQEQDQQSDDQQENEDQEQQQGEDDQQQDQDKEQDQEQDQDQQDEQNQNSPEDQEADGQQQPLPDQISREEAQNILNALEQLEREILESRKKEATDPQTSNDKDW